MPTLQGPSKAKQQQQPQAKQQQQPQAKQQQQQPQAKQQQQQQAKQQQQQQQPQAKQQQQQQAKQQQQQPKQQQLGMQVQQQPQASNTVVVRMAANPLLDRLTAYDVQYLRSPGMINDELVNFHLGTCQLEALHICHNAEQSWVFLNTWYFDKLSRSFSEGEYDMLFRLWFKKQRFRYLKKPWYEHTHIFLPIHKGVHGISATLHMQQKELVC